MYRELYQYLILHKQLHLPGIGTLSIEKKPADFNIPDKIINPTTYTIALGSDQSTPSKSFFNWLGSKLGITERDAVISFNNFLFDLRKQLASGNKLQWTGVGVFSKSLAGDISLEPELKNHSPASPVSANKVLRENAEHIIRVGEQEKTSWEMRELLSSSQEGAARSWLWTTALIIAILSILFIGFYFSVKGVNVSSASNQQHLVPQSATKTHL